MTKRGSGKIVSTVTYAVTGESINIRLLKNPMRFRAELGDRDLLEFFEDKDGDTVSAWALDALKRNGVVKWTPVIELFLPEIEYVKRGLAGLVLHYRRFYMGKSPKGWKEVPWDRFNADEPSRMGDAVAPLELNDSRGYRNFGFGVCQPEEYGFDGSLPYYSHLPNADDYDWEDDVEERARMITLAKRGVLLAYDETTWAIITEIDATIQRARTQLASLIEHPESLSVLSASLSPLLAIKAANSANDIKEEYASRHNHGANERINSATNT